MTEAARRPVVLVRDGGRERVGRTHHWGDTETEVKEAATRLIVQVRDGERERESGARTSGATQKLHGGTQRLR